LTEEFQREVFRFLEKKGIENFIGVPDSTLKNFIKEGIEREKIIIATREEEAIGISVGMMLTGSNSLVFMQNAGFANSLSTITSLIQLYKFPLIFLIGWRGYKKNDAPEHTKIGKIQPELLKSLQLKSKILDQKNWEKKCQWAIMENKQGNSCALIVPRELID
tara:strand:- start:1777 stop:2265 length:489 start_codon:yes stop_codon:yes gene_type:complete